MIGVDGGSSRNGVCSAAPRAECREVPSDEAWAVDAWAVDAWAVDAWAVDPRTVDLSTATERLRGPASQPAAGMDRRLRTSRGDERGPQSAVFFRRLFGPWEQWLRLAVFLALGVPGSVSAQPGDIVLLPPGGSESLPEEAGAEAHRQVRTALETVGFTVRGDAEVAERCGDDPACIAEAVPLAAMVSVWSRQGQREPSEVTVTIIEGSALHDGRAELDGATLPMASARAVASALARHRGEGQGRLVIRGTPRGANVVVDGVRVGRLPEAEVRVEPGEHGLSVSHAGFESLRRRVRSSAEVTTIQVALEEASVDVEEQPRAHPGRWQMVAGGGLIAVGAVGIGIGVADAVAGDECSSDCSGANLEGRRFGAASGVVLGLGVAAVAAGVGLVVRGIRLRSSISEDSAALEATFRF